MADGNKMNIATQISFARTADAERARAYANTGKNKLLYINILSKRDEDFGTNSTIIVTRFRSNLMYVRHPR